jgi:adenine-specific DNA methylase
VDWEAREPVTILDPFMGGGTTVVEALRLGANVVGVDLNPVAWFVTKKETDGCDLELLERAFKAVEARVAERIKCYYRTKCPCCGEQADVMYNFWVKLAPCQERTCGAEVPLFNSFILAKKTGGKGGADVPRSKQGKAGMRLADGKEMGVQFVVCESCGEIYASKEKLTGDDLTKSTCPKCKHTFNPSVGYAKSGRYTCQAPKCGRQSETLTAAQRNIPKGSDRNVPLPYRLFGVELYCPHCEYKGYQKAMRGDRALFNEAKAEFERTKDELGFPHGRIPPDQLSTGVEHDLDAHGFHYWHELFNERQLLCLCWLREAILGLTREDLAPAAGPTDAQTTESRSVAPCGRQQPAASRQQTPTRGYATGESGEVVGEEELWNVKEYLVLAWSAAVENQNTYCRYNALRDSTEGIFASHALVPKMTYGEGSVWGADFGRGSFRGSWDQVEEGQRWAKSPEDNYFAADLTQVKTGVPDGISGAGSARLFAQSSESLVDCWDTRGEQRASAAITDPPYYGNVMYAELSDFFYVWLHTALRDRYPNEFGNPSEVPGKDEEVVEQFSRAAPLSADELSLPVDRRVERQRERLAQRGIDFLTKDEEFFTTGLTRIFAEADRYLEDHGVFVFTFHHQANEAWGSVLRTVLDAGLYVTAIYPVHAEMVSSLHIQDKANISYDVVIVCRKQTVEPERADWLDLSDRIYPKAERLVKELEYRSHSERGVPPEDIYVIVIGKCLEEYSRHNYDGRSYVFKGDEPVSIEDALNGNESRAIRGIGAIVDQLVEEAEGRLWPAGLDPVSRFYAINFLGQTEVPYDRLHRRLQHNSQIDLADLERQHLIETKGGKVKVVPEADREAYLTDLLADADESDDGDRLTYLDRLHFLQIHDKRSVLVGGLVAQWQEDPTFVDFAQRAAAYLAPSSKAQSSAQRVAEALTARTTGRLF